MSGDALSDLLRAVRLRGAVFYYVEGDPPWVAEAPHVREIIPAIKPGTEHMIEFHGIVEGSCWGAIAWEPGLYLEAGDVVMFPHGHGRRLTGGVAQGNSRPYRPMNKRWLV